MRFRRHQLSLLVRLSLTQNSANHFKKYSFCLKNTFSCVIITYSYLDIKCKCLIITVPLLVPFQKHVEDANALANSCTGGGHGGECLCRYHHSPYHSVESFVELITPTACYIQYIISQKHPMTAWPIKHFISVERVTKPLFPQC